MRIILLLNSFLLLAFHSYAQQTFRGRVVDAETGEAIARVKTSAGYDEGMFAKVEVMAEGAFDVDGGLLVAGMTSRVDRWAADVAAGRAKASPLAPVLSD